MKKIMLFIAVLAMTFNVEAQIKTPAPSPLGKIEQRVGLTDVTVEYSRPSMRGRKIFGDLVPYGKMWRTGANKNTTISFSTDVSISREQVKAGTYAIFTIPDEEKWEVILYSDTENWGTPEKLEESKIVARFNAKVMEIPMTIETFTVSIDDLTNNSAILALLWANSYVSIPLEVPTSQMVSSDIQRILNGPSAADYYSAAVYYLQEEKELKQAKEWMEKAMQMTPEPKFWQLRQQSLLYAKLGDKPKAIAAAKKSLEAAQKAGNDDYIKMNKESLIEWGAM